MANKNPKRKDLTGLIFHRLTVVDFAGLSPSRGAIWRCLCQCGNYVAIRAPRLTQGRQKSCGCYKKEEFLSRVTKHGNSLREHKSATYNSWLNMKARCNNPKSIEYKNYGGRGISVCDAWADSFETFLEDMGKRPANTTLDRIDTNKDYNPENCRWSSPKIQQNNRRNNRRIEFNGVTQTLAQWSDELGINWFTLFYRLKSGKSISESFLTPVKNNRNNTTNMKHGEQ